MDVVSSNLDFSKKRQKSAMKTACQLTYFNLRKILKNAKKHIKRAKNKRFWLFFDRISNFGQRRWLSNTK